MQSFKNDKILPKTSQETPKFSIFIFLPAAIMHLTSRCLVFLALNFTTASSFQMLSGANLIFTCLLSRLFLKRKLEWWKWLAIFIIIGIPIIRVFLANGPFHGLFGWNGLLRISFFSSEMTINWLFLWKILWNMLCLLCNTTQAADNNKALSEENKILVWNFFKNSHFFVISDEKRKFSKHCFSQKVRETDRLPSA